MRARKGSVAVLALAERLTKRLRRWWLHAAVLVVLAVSTVLVVRSASGWRPQREVTVEQCFVDPALCMAGDRSELYVVGTYAPRSYASTAECATRVTLQSPGGVRPGKLEVCMDEPSRAFDGICDESDDPRMKLVVANGYYRLRVKGRLERSVLHAKEIRGAGCDSKYHAWLFGDAAVRDPAPR